MSFVALNTEGISSAIDRCNRWIAATPSIAVHIGSRLEFAGGRVNQDRLDLVRENGRLFVHWRSPGTERQGPFEWVYEFGGSRLKGYDLMRQERMDRPAVPKDFISILPEAAQLLLIRSAFYGFAHPLSQVKGWHQTGKELYVLKTRGAVTQFKFSPGTGAPVEFKLDSKSSKTDWKFNYGAVESLPPAGGASWTKVAAFLVPRPYPDYRDPEARSVARRAVDAYQRLHELRVQVDGYASPVRVWRTLDGDVWEVGQDGPNGHWRYKKGILSAQANGHFYEGKVSRGEIATKLDSLGLPLDILARALVLGENFAAQTFTKVSGVVRPLGQIGSNSLVELDEGLSLTQVSVAADGFVNEVSTRTLTAGGKTFSKSDRRYTVSNFDFPAFIGNPEPFAKTNTELDSPKARAARRG